MDILHNLAFGFEHALTWQNLLFCAIGCTVGTLVGLLPGPGGIFVFAAGAALVLQTSPWAKRLYVRAKRRWPRAGSLVDRALRRQSAQRRREREKVALAGASAEAPG